MTVDHQSHWLPRTCLDLLVERQAGYPRVERSGGQYALETSPGRYLFFDRVLPDRILELEHQLEEAERHGIDVLVSSPNALGDVWDFGADEADEFLRTLNAEMADQQRRYPDRFRGLAFLPLHHPQRAIDVLDDAVLNLGLRGVCMLSSIRGAMIATDATLPVFKRIEQLGVPVFLHPAPRSNTDEPFLGNRIEGALGWMYHTAAAALSLIESRTLDECPDLQIVHPHLGGTLPYVVGRIAKMSGNADRPLMDYLRTQFYTDTVSTTPAALDLAIDVYGAARVLFATDYPFEDMGVLRAFVEESTSAENADAILNRNAVPGLADLTAPR